VAIEVPEERQWPYLGPAAHAEHVHEDGLELGGEHGVHQEVHTGVHQYQVLHHRRQDRQSCSSGAKIENY
jgi:hypothetical protein